MRVLASTPSRGDDGADASPLDLLVIGSGVAGCAAALEAAARGKRVTVLTKAAADPLRENNSYWAQGGIIYKSADPSEASLLAADIKRAGAGRCREDAVAKLAAEGPAAMEALLLGPDAAAEVPFDRDPADPTRYALCLEASHNRARIVHWRDHTGRAIMESLMAAIEKHPNVTLRSGATAVDLLLAEVDVDRPACDESPAGDESPKDKDEDEGRLFPPRPPSVASEANQQPKVRLQEQRSASSSASSLRVCAGAVVLDEATGRLLALPAAATVLATGGCGDLFEHTSNPPGCRGDGVAMALRAGAAMGGMEFMQFHPTTLFVPGERRFLLTEALRGEGAILRDFNGRAFAKEYHPDGELAPRDVVARMIADEMRAAVRAGRPPCAYLDISHRGRAFIETRFPSIFAHCLARGLDPSAGPLPVVPAAHYFCGGVRVDLAGRTSLPGLFAAGEVSCSGLHGANRLASTSLLEGLVWGYAAAEAVCGSGRGGGGGGGGSRGSGSACSVSSEGSESSNGSGSGGGSGSGTESGSECADSESESRSSGSGEVWQFGAGFASAAEASSDKDKEDSEDGDDEKDSEEEGWRFLARAVEAAAAEIAASSGGAFFGADDDAHVDALADGAVTVAASTAAAEGVVHSEADTDTSEGAGVASAAAAAAAAAAAVERMAEMKHVMSTQVGIVRRPADLRTAAATLKAILQNELEPAYQKAAAAATNGCDHGKRTARLTSELIDARNAATVSLAIASAAAANPVSVGTHFVVSDEYDDGGHGGGHGGDGEVVNNQVDEHKQASNVSASLDA